MKNLPTILVVDINSQEFKDAIKEIVKEAINDCNSQKDPYVDIPDIIRKRKIVAKLLDISISTVATWIQYGKIKRYYDEFQKPYFLKEEILKLLMLK